MKQGHGPRMPRIAYLRGKNASSRVMLNGGVTQKITLIRSVRQRCSLSPLLFTILTHPATCGDIVGLHLA